MPTFILFQIQIRISVSVSVSSCASKGCFWVCLLPLLPFYLFCMLAVQQKGIEASEEQWPCIASWLCSVSRPGFTGGHLCHAFFWTPRKQIFCYNSLIFFFSPSKFKSNFDMGFVSVGKVEWWMWLLCCILLMYLVQLVAVWVALSLQVLQMSAYISCKLFFSCTDVTGLRLFQWRLSWCGCVMSVHTSGGSMLSWLPTKISEEEI